MVRSLDQDAHFEDLTLRAHAPRAETRGLAYADREDVAQEALLVLCQRWRASGEDADVAALPKILGGVLRNVGRNAKRRRGVCACREIGSDKLDSIAEPQAAQSQDCCEMLTAQERTWFEGFAGPLSNDDLAKTWAVHPATVSRRHNMLEQRLIGLMKADRVPRNGA